MDPIFRPISPNEYHEVLDHWDLVFPVNKEFFARYYDADPWNREGDTFGAWLDGKIVSALHVCRRPLIWNGRTILCGGIANVATHPGYQSRGLSGELLRMVIAHMERDRFDFSMLGTGVHSHYARFGWETVNLPRFTVSLNATVPLETRLISGPAIPSPAIQALHERDSRPLHLPRPGTYFEKWTGWIWANSAIELAVLPDRGYAVTRFPENQEAPACVMEWQAVDQEAESVILLEAAAWAISRGRRKIHFEGVPQFGGIQALERLGSVEPETDTSHMLRNFGLTDADYAEVKRLYATGEANWWESDAF